MYMYIHIYVCIYTYRWIVKPAGKLHGRDIVCIL